MEPYDVGPMTLTIIPLGLGLVESKPDVLVTNVTSWFFDHDDVMVTRWTRDGKREIVKFPCYGGRIRVLCEDRRFE